MSETRSEDPINVASPKSEDFTVPRFTGLTKREYFAAKAMEGFLSNPQTSINPKNPDPMKKAVKFADKLIVELNKDS